MAIRALVIALAAVADARIHRVALHENKVRAQARIRMPGGHS